MAATATAKKKTTGKKTTTNWKNEILDRYKKYILLNGEDPNSIFQFTEGLGIEEQVFYNYFSSFSAINKHVWLQYFEQTSQALSSDKNYQNYSAREKMLAFYFTLIEALKRDRSYVSYTFSSIKKPQLTPNFLQDFKGQFHEYVRLIIGEGLETEEIVKRPVIGDRYFEGIWLQLLFVINFWLKDDSKNFENTDAAIEKSVNLSFELMGKGPLDNMIDFAKFLFHNRK